LTITYSCSRGKTRRPLIRPSCISISFSWVSSCLCICHIPFTQSPNINWNSAASKTTILSSRPNRTSRYRCLASHCRHPFVLWGLHVSPSSSHSRSITVCSNLRRWPKSLHDLWCAFPTGCISTGCIPTRCVPTPCYRCILLLPILPSPSQKQDQPKSQQRKKDYCKSNPHFRTRRETTFAGL